MVKNKSEIPDDKQKMHNNEKFLNPMGIADFLIADQYLMTEGVTFSSVNGSMHFGNTDDSNKSTTSNQVTTFS